MLSILTNAVCDKDQIVNKIWQREEIMEKYLKS